MIHAQQNLKANWQLRLRGQLYTQTLTTHPPISLARSRTPCASCSTTSLLMTPGDGVRLAAGKDAGLRRRAATP